MDPRTSYQAQQLRARRGARARRLRLALVAALAALLAAAGASLGYGFATAGQPAQPTASASLGPGSAREELIAGATPAAPPPTARPDATAPPAPTATARPPLAAGAAAATAGQAAGQPAALPQTGGERGNGWFVLAGALLLGLGAGAHVAARRIKA